jgi:hypothetical protein
VPELLDERAVLDRTGMKKNDYGMGTASIPANGYVVKESIRAVEKRT